MQAHLDSSNNVIAVSYTEYTLFEAQQINAETVSLKNNCPDTLISMTSGQHNGEPAYYHRYVQDTGEELSHYEEIERLDAYKDYKCDLVDTHTYELVSSGYEYPADSGDYFSLSQAAIDQLLGVYMLKDHAAMSYPLTWASLGNGDPLTINNATEFEGFFLTAFGTYKALMDSGNSIKTSIRACTTKAAIDAIEDSR